MGLCACPGLFRQMAHFVYDLTYRKQEEEALEAYTGFAAVYDTFMDNVPYREWGEYIHSMLCEKGVKDGLVLDLGCGTGTMTEILAGYGYDMIGADNSEDMLELAM